MKRCSASITEHLLRGALAAAAIAGGIYWFDMLWPSLLLFPAAIILMRGGPGCWIAGLIETVRNRAASETARDEAMLDNK
ncbi:MAG: hypothetical protein WDO70_03245 [Alphaproteobacteria bacterium]